MFTATKSERRGGSGTRAAVGREDAPINQQRSGEEGALPPPGGHFHNGFFLDYLKRVNTPNQSDVNHCWCRSGFDWSSVHQPSVKH